MALLKSRKYSSPGGPDSGKQDRLVTLGKYILVNSSNFCHFNCARHWNVLCLNVCVKNENNTALISWWRHLNDMLHYSGFSRKTEPRATEREEKSGGGEGWILRNRLTTLLWVLLSPKFAGQAGSFGKSQCFWCCSLEFEGWILSSLRDLSLFPEGLQPIRRSPPALSEG